VSGLSGLDEMAHDFGGARDRAADRPTLFATGASLMEREGIPQIFARGWSAPRAWDTGFALLRGPEDSILHSLQLVPESDRLVYGTTHPGGHAHNLGAVITAKQAPYLVFRTPNGYARKKSVTLPQRQYIYFPPEIVEKLLKIHMAHVAGLD